MKTQSILIALLCATFATPALAADGKGMTWGFRHMSFDNGLHANTLNAEPHSEGIPFALGNNNSGVGKKSVHVSCGSFTEKGQSNAIIHCNAYTGDTSCQLERPILCVKEGGAYKKRPPYKVTGSGTYDSGWVGRPIKLTQPVKGADLQNFAHASTLCGNGWRMADHHDGRWINGMSDTQHFGNSWNVNATRHGGWGFHARFRGINNNNKRNLLKNSRFWVHVKDTRGNCWN